VARRLRRGLDLVQHLWIDFSCHLMPSLIFFSIEILDRRLLDLLLSRHFESLDARGLRPW
jgi:hypothetical protein